MIRTLWAAALAVPLLTSCAPDLATVMTALKADPASACLSIRSVWVSVEACRTATPGTDIAAGDIKIVHGDAPGVPAVSPGVHQ